MRIKFGYSALFIIAMAAIIPILKEKYNTYWYYNIAGKAITKLLLPTGQAHGGTGFQIKYKGKRYTLTNDHVCAGAKKEGYMIAAPSLGTVQELRILSWSDETDLCLLEPIKEAPYLELAKKGALKYDKITVLGHPLLSSLKASPGVLLKKELVTIFSYIIRSEEDKNSCSGKKYQIQPVFWGLFDGCFIQINSNMTSAKVKPGNSGSPVLNEEGSVIGVLFASDRAGNGYLVPLKDVRNFLKSYNEAHQ